MFNLLMIQNMIHLQQGRNPSPKNRKKSLMKYAKETCMT
jgi:hypothetical protein